MVRRERHHCQAAAGIVRTPETERPGVVFDDRVHLILEGAAHPIGLVPMPTTTAVACELMKATVRLGAEEATIVCPLVFRSPVWPGADVTETCAEATGRIIELAQGGGVLDAV